MRLLITVPYTRCVNNTRGSKHEATTSKVDDDQLFHCRSRGMDEEGKRWRWSQRLLPPKVLQACPDGIRHGSTQLVAISLEGRSATAWPLARTGDIGMAVAGKIPVIALLKARLDSGRSAGCGSMGARIPLWASLFTSPRGQCGLGPIYGGC